jgi:hypothetical protein
MKITCQHRHVGGQAMTEFVVSVAFVFMVLFVAVPMLGKIMDMQFQNQQASRYIAWERTVWLQSVDASRDTHDDFVVSSAEFESVAVRSDDQMIASMHNRFFNNQGRNLPTQIFHDDIFAGSGPTSPLWTYVQSKQTMYDSTTVANQHEQATPGVAYGIFGAVQDGLKMVTTPINVLLNLVGGDKHFLHLNFNQKGYYAPIVKTTLRKTNAHGGGDGVWDREGGQWGSGIEDAIFQVWDGTLTSRAGILADGWSAQSKSYYQNHTDNLVLSNVFDLPLFDVLKTAASILEGGPDNSAINKLEFGAVGIEPMPTDDQGAPLSVTCDGGFCSYVE